VSRLVLRSRRGLLVLAGIAGGRRAVRHRPTRASCDPSRRRRRRRHPSSCRPRRESRLGIRRKTGQLFDVEIAVVGADGALCAVSGVARLRPGETLVLPVRPEPGKAAKPPAAPCLVSLRDVAGTVEVETSEPACQAQALCAGQVQLNGQRFEPATRMPAGAATRASAPRADALRDQGGDQRPEGEGRSSSTGRRRCTAASTSPRATRSSVFASENEGGAGLSPRASSRRPQAIPRKAGIERQTPCVDIAVRRVASSRAASAAPS
jgi:hypothetical protein